MKKVNVLYSANIEKTFEISDELYSEISNDEFDWRAFESMFELSPNPYIYLNDLLRVENAETEECIYEY